MVTLSEGDNVTITCTATGVPVPSVTWIRADGSSLTDSRYVISDISSSMVVNDVYQVTRNLTIRNIIREDAGAMYGCTVTNVVNTVQSNVNIIVLCKWIVVYCRVPFFKDHKFHGFHETSVLHENYRNILY